MNMYIMGIPVSVTIDDYLPFWTNTPTGLYYARASPDRSIWMPLLEKAAAKLYGNYEMLSGGWMGHAIQALTGAPHYETNHEDISVNDLFNKI